MAGRHDHAGTAPSQILGECAPMRRLFGQIAAVAASDATVHLHGETGTGKERVAQALHEGSPRRGRPFIPVNGAALSDELFQSTLFGHVRGAFSGATSDRPGLVMAAEGGTLFIDEVTELSRLSQARLLRFLQDREYHRLGDPYLRRADVRIVTAANTCLRERAASGEFRDDLIYRIQGVELQLPPLRERGADVLRLARHFLAEAAERESKPGLRLSPEAEAAITDYAWPGNVRQLESEMGRVAIFATGTLIGVDALRPEIRESVAESPATLQGLLAGHERKELLRALTAHAGNRTRTARSLGISRQALHSKLRRLLVEAPTDGFTPAA